MITDYRSVCLSYIFRHDYRLPICLSVCLSVSVCPSFRCTCQKILESMSQERAIVASHKGLSFPLLSDKYCLLLVFLGHYLLSSPFISLKHMTSKFWLVYQKKMDSLQTERYTQRYTHKGIHRKTDRETDRQTDRETDRQRDRQTDRLTR